MAQVASDLFPFFHPDSKESKNRQNAIDWGNKFFAHSIAVSQQALTTIKTNNPKATPEELEGILQFHAGIVVMSKVWERVLAENEVLMNCCKDFINKNNGVTDKPQDNTATDMQYDPLATGE